MQGFIRTAPALATILTAMTLGCAPDADRPAARSPGAPFTDVTDEAGLGFRHVNGAFGQRYLPETMGSGLALLDYDGDGRLDIFFVQGGEWAGHETGPSSTMALYRNMGGMHFVDRSEATGADVRGYGMGVAVADYDADGDPDIYITCLGPNILLRNDAGRFRDVAAQAGVAGIPWRGPGGRRQHHWSSSAAWFDHDRDGDLDLLVANYIRWSPETDLFTSLDGIHKAYTVPTEYPGDTCRLYDNRGDGTFRDVTAAVGLEDNLEKALGLALEDINGDGREDLLVANDTCADRLYLSSASGRYRDAALEAGIAYDDFGHPRAGMGIDTAVETGDNGTVIAIGNFSRESIAFYRRSEGIFFNDAAAPAGLSRATLASLTFGLLFVDTDLDGTQELLLANGHIEPEIRSVQPEISYRQPMQMFHKQSSGRYRQVTEPAGSALHRPIVGRGLAAGDLDGDGDPDIVVTTNNGVAHLLRNDQRTGNHFLRVALRAATPNRQALGARVLLVAGGQRQWRRVRTGSSYLSQSEITLTFGLGGETSAERIEVDWPDGRRTSHGPLRADRMWLLRDDGTAGSLDASGAPRESPR